MHNALFSTLFDIVDRLCFVLKSAINEVSLDSLVKQGIGIVLLDNNRRQVMHDAAMNGGGLFLD